MTVARIGRRTMFKTLLAGGLAAATGAVGYGAADERLDIQIVRSPLPIDDLPSALEGFRIGLITDLHHGPQVSFEQVRRSARLTAAEAPDLIVLAGDYINTGQFRYAEPCAEALSILHAPQGVFAVLGNHDDEMYVPAALRRQGFEVLADARTERRIRGERVCLAGIRFWTYHPQAIAKLARPPQRTILLAHDPRRIWEAAEVGVSAVLSGHTHGGQILLPLIGSPIANRYPVLQGLAVRDRTTLFVSRGVGTVTIPLRLNCPPDISILTLTARTRRG